MRQFTAVVDRMGMPQSREDAERRKISPERTPGRCMTPRLSGGKLVVTTFVVTPRFTQRIMNTSQIHHERNWIELTASESNTSLS